ncbi:hypothetical protein [Ligilactobacillus saerimneri]|uniref:hypothetical protein n=1 Tax=Ligilactobacillus saerimneri TaxID=228229 RepID=UPI001C10C408|nr:hypothetical protein [Ligilactobacillus saerimneri]MBU5309423.1 hypothetical protein [Ligilactobacillus saerimneri]
MPTDIRKYYINNIDKIEYHYQFLSEIKSIPDDSSFEVWDTQSAIKKFKRLCNPRISRDKYTVEDECWFHLITYYLYKFGYEIEEFPDVLARPPLNVHDFAYDEIRSRIISQGGQEADGKVTWEKRLNFVKKLSFKQKVTHIGISDYIEQKFIEISTRNAAFDDMDTDEKLKEIVNLIENMLKKENGKYDKLDYSKLCFDYVSDEKIRTYKNKLQCFRHASDANLKQRESFSDEQKNFLIDFGLIILKAIYVLRKNDLPE